MEIIIYPQATGESYAHTHIRKASWKDDGRDRKMCEDNARKVSKCINVVRNIGFGVMKRNTKTYVFRIMFELCFTKIY